MGVGEVQEPDHEDIQSKSIDVTHHHFGNDPSKCKEVQVVDGSDLPRIQGKDESDEVRDLLGQIDAAEDFDQEIGVQMGELLVHDLHVEEDAVVVL